MKFPSNLNCDGKIVSEMGPWATFISNTGTHNYTHQVRQSNWTSSRFQPIIPCPHFQGNDWMYQNNETLCWLKDYKSWSFIAVWNDWSNHFNKYICFICVEKKLYCMPYSVSSSKNQLSSTVAVSTDSNNAHTSLCTVECCYDNGQYNEILYAVMKLQKAEYWSNFELIPFLWIYGKKFLFYKKTSLQYPPSHSHSYPHQPGTLSLC